VGSTFICTTTCILRSKGLFLVASDSTPLTQISKGITLPQPLSPLKKTNE
jgi:hypothetical protein